MNLKFNLRRIAKLGANMTVCLLVSLVSLSAAAATISYSQSFSAGWNLAGNGLTTTIDVKTTFGAQAGITTIWKWDATATKWAFYAPSLDTAGTLTSYAASKGYSVLTTINQGEGYWVNASTPVSLGTASGTGFSLASSNLVTGWNLAATADRIAPAAFTTNVGNVTTLWAWDNANSAWYFYAPSLAANSTLAGYITSKNYKDFGLLTLDNGRGFWVNYAGAPAGGGTGGATAPAAPTNATATASSATQISVNWTNVTGATAYNIYRSTSANVQLISGNKISAQPTAGPFSDSGLTAATMYYYKVTAVNAAGESIASSEISATTSAAASGTGTTPATTACLVTATSSWTGPTGVTVPLSANYCFALTTPFTCDVKGMGETASIFKSLFQTVYVAATPTSIGYTPSCASAPANMQPGSEALMKTIDGNGSVTTLAGKATPAPSSAAADSLVDGVATEARFALNGSFGPSVVVTDGTSLFVLDQDNYAIRKVDVSTGAVSTLAGGSRGLLDGTGKAAMFYAPRAMTIDDTHTNLYVIDYTDIRKIEIATGVVTTMPIKTEKVWDQYAGDYGAYITCCFINQTSSAQDRFTAPTSLAVDGGTMYVQDGARIVQVDMTTWKVSNWLSSSPVSAGTMILNSGNLYFLGDKTVNKVNIASKTVSSVAGGGAGVSRDGIGSQAGFNFNAKGLTTDGINLYVADNNAIRKIELATSIVSTLAGSNSPGYADGMGAAAKFSGLGGMAMVGTYLYATDNYSAIRRIQTNGTGSATASPISNSTASTGPMAGTWSYSSPGGAAWSSVTDTTVPNGGTVFKAAAVGQNQSTIASMTVTLTKASTATFYRKVDSLACCDFLTFTVDGVEPANARWSGSVPWGQASFPLTAGTHTLRWNYVKGGATYVNTNGVLDSAWISQVNVADNPPAISGLTPTSGPVDTAVSIQGSDLGNFPVSPTVNFSVSAGVVTTSYPAPVPYTWGANNSNVDFPVPQDLPAGSYNVTLGSGATAPLSAGTFTIPVIGTQIGGARQGVALNLGTGVITLAGAGLAPVNGNAANGITTDGTSLYVSNAAKIYRVVLASGEVSVLAGGGVVQAGVLYQQSYCTPTDGIGAVASFCGGGAMTTDGTNVYVADSSIGSVRKIVIATGEVSTLGVGGNTVITTDGTHLYAAYRLNPIVQKLNLTTSVVTTLAGSGLNNLVDGTGTGASFKGPTAITTDGTSVYVMDNGIVRKIDPTTGAVTTEAAGGPGAALLGRTNGVSVTTDGLNLYSITLNGIVKTLTARTNTSTPTVISTTINSASSVTLSWTKVAGAASYNVYRSTSPNVAITYANKANTTTTTTTQQFVDSGLASATTYYYKVTSVSATNVESVGSAEIAVKTLIAPVAPTGVTAVAAGTTKIDLSWNAVTGATGYNVYSSTSANVQAGGGSKTGQYTTTSTQVTGLFANTLYYFKVTAVNANGESLGSTEVSVRTAALPAAPTGVSAVAAGGTQINVSWTAATGAASYNVYRGNSLLINTTQTSYSDTGLIPGTSYNYGVKSVNAAGELSIQFSTSVSATTASPPTAPTGASSTSVGGSQININWTNVTGATAYNIYRATAANVQIIAGNKITTATQPTAGPYSDTGLTGGATYYYKVTAVNAVGESLGSTETTARAVAGLGAPTGVSAAAVSGTQISVNWTNVAGATGYNIYRATAANVQIIAANKLPVQPTASPLLDTGLTLGTTYYYKVVTVNASGEGLVSAEVTASKAFPAEPTGVSATVVSATQINLNWVGVTGATGYKIYRATTPNVTIVAGNLVSSAASPVPNAGAYWDSGLVAGTNYYYKVVAINGAAVSTSSAEISAVTPAATTPPVVGVQMGGGRIGSALTLSASVTTVAGYSTTGVSANGIGKAASFNTPAGVATDGVNLYVADTGSHTIRKVVLATGETTTLAGSGTAALTNGTGTAASFNNPTGITTDGVNVYVADTSNNAIRQIVIATGVVSTLAGTGVAGAVDAVGTAASFNLPYGITTDGTSLFVADRSNHKIRQIAISTGAVSTFAGAGTIGATDGVGVVAKFNYPYGIATDGVNLYVADTFNNMIRKIEIATKTVATLAGKGSLYPGPTDGTGTAAWFKAPYSLTTDGTNVYVADKGNSEIRKIVVSTGVVTTLAGAPSAMGYVDGVGAAARLHDPAGMTTDGVSLYVADFYNYNIRKIQ